MRNKQFFWMMALCLFVFFGGMACLKWGFSPFTVYFLSGGALLALFFFYTALRYRQIRLLSNYLSAVVNGEPPLDIRDNREGELSILKNDIYKTGLILRSQTDRLKKDKVYLADSLSDISHQLRTPLAGISVMTELLQQENLPKEERARFLKGIEVQLERLRWMVETLLKLSRLDAGQVQFRYEHTSLAALTKQAAEPLRPQMEKKGQAFSVEGDAALFCDRRWTAEALVNLLKNCMEHAPEGGVVRVFIQQGPLHILWCAEDDGPGFDREDFPHLFERFYRGKNAGDDSVGIGLALSKAVLGGQRAALEAENRPEGGARFLVRFFLTELS